MRRILGMFLALTMLSLCACGAPASDQGDNAPTETEKTLPGEGTENSPSDGNTAVGIIEPSELISQEEAESIIGTSLGPAEISGEESVGVRVCLYASEDHLFLLQIALTQQAMMPEWQKQTPESLYRAIVENFEDAVQVEGIGDEAYFATPGLHILADGYYILIAVGNSDDEANREKLLVAGKLAVENLEAIIK